MTFRSPCIAMFALGALLAASPCRGQGVTEPSLKGYGIKGVAGATLADMLARCAAARRGQAELDEGETPALLAARCAQLERSLRTQPGNSPQAARR